MPQALSAIIWTHLTAGFAALLLMWIPILSPKGSRLHRRAGMAYVIAMVVVAITALLAAAIRVQIALAAGKPLAAARFSVFLAFIALLAFTSAFCGVRILRQKNRTGPHTNPFDIGVPAALLVCSIAVSIWGFTLGDPLLSWFPLIGAGVAIGPLRTQLRPPADRMFWFYQHISSMLASCIAAVTAATLVNYRTINDLLGFRVPPVVLWLGPSLIGGAIIAASIIKYQRKFGPRPLASPAPPPLL